MDNLTPSGHIPNDVTSSGLQPTQEDTTHERHCILHIDDQPLQKSRFSFQEIKTTGINLQV